MTKMLNLLSHLLYIKTWFGFALLNKTNSTTDSHG